MIPEPPGFFGKLPARGDFLACRVPGGLVSSWDAWLSQFTVAVREAAGAAWPDIWLTAPLWHFALGAALAPPAGAAGLLVTSVDRVGRMFPFTVVGACAGVPADSWSAAIEALVMQSFDDDFRPETLDAALQQLGAPAAAAALPAGQSLWWSRGSDHVPPSRHTVPGLPGPALAAAMVLGEG